MTKDVHYWIEKLNLEPHQEGGYFKQVFQSITNNNDNRSVLTSIYFLLEKGNYSAFHRLDADEIWNFHYGSPITIVAIDEDGKLHEYYLGIDIEKNQNLQIIIPSGWIFASYCDEGFGIAGCAVAPGFMYEHFELFTKKQLMELYPEYENYYDKLAYRNN